MADSRADKQKSGVEPSENGATFGIRDFSGALLAKNSLYNLVGSVLPLALAVVAIPFLVKYMGTERFGVLTLAWMVSGYFSLFDMGIGRATTKFVADYQALGRYDEMRSLVTTSLLILTAIGCAGGIATAVATPWLVRDLLNIPEPLVGESLTAFLLLAAAVPFTVLTAGARGVLEAQQRFAIINAIKIPFSAATFLLPLLMLYFSVSLVPIIAALVVSRVALVLIYLWYGRMNIRLRGGTGIFKRDQLKRLLGFGGWLTVSQLLPPLMGNVDRFFIGAILTMTAVAYYATPFDTMAKLGVFPNAILGVLFPVFSVYALDQLERLARLYRRAIAYILLIITPAAIGLVAAGDIILNLWLGSAFAKNSTTVLQVLAIGLLVSSIARVSGNVIQAAGRPDLTAKLFLIELPIYIGALVICTDAFGIVGAACVWSARIVIETAILFLMCRPLMGMSGQDFLQHNGKLVVWMALAMAVAFFAAGIDSKVIRMAVTLPVMAAVPVIGAFVLLDRIERGKLRDTVKSVFRLGRG